MRLAAALALVAFGLLMFAWETGAVDEFLLWLGG